MKYKKNHEYKYYIRNRDEILPLPPEDNNNFIATDEYGQGLYVHNYGMGSVHYPVLKELSEKDLVTKKHNQIWAKNYLNKFKYQIEVNFITT